MNITDKPAADKHARAPIPNSGLRWALQAAEEVTGKQGMAIVLRQAGLEVLIDHYPPEDSTFSDSHTWGEYARLNAGLLTFFGRAGRSMVLRIGRNAMHSQIEIDRKNPVISAALAAIHILPEKMRMKASLSAIIDGFDRLYKPAGIRTPPMRSGEHPDGWFFAFDECGGCAGKQSDAPMCYLGAGFLQEGIQWLTNKEYDVREIECRAMGAAACLFIIQPKG